MSLSGFRSATAFLWNWPHSQLPMGLADRRGRADRKGIPTRPNFCYPYIVRSAIIKTAY